MRKTIASILFLMLAGVMAGCHTNVINWNDIDGGDDGGGGGGQPSLTIYDRSQLDQYIPAESGVCEVIFAARSSWFTEIPDENTLRWISVTPRFSDITGEHILRISVDENTTGGERMAQLVLFCGGQSETITITQQPLRSDGTEPEPYQPDLYTDVVSRIAIRDLQNQTPDAPSYEWRFVFDEQQRRVYRMEHVILFQDWRLIVDEYNFHNNSMFEHNTFRLDESGTTPIIVRQETIEIEINDYGHIRSQLSRVFDMGSGNPEPVEYRTAYNYSNYRLASAQADNQQTTYVWSDGNLTQLLGQDMETQYTYMYDAALNDRTNIDLNMLLTSDVYGAVGLLGKRSRNLLVSRTHAQGLQDAFEYTFDADGRVETITHNIVNEGDVLPIFLYTVYYENDTNTSK